LGFSGLISNDLLSLQSVPAILESDAILNCLENIMNELAFQEIDKGEVAHTILLSLARSTALGKAPLKTNEEAIALTEQLFSCKEHAYSPGGKKIVETITLNELDSKL
jgi:DNA mismatch repair ATPase MutL